MEPNEDISRLLRLKRYEQPPPGYHETFLREFQRRQRAAMMRRPWYAKAWERMVNFMDYEFEVPRLAYATVALLAVATSALVITMNPRNDDASALAAREDANNEPNLSLSPKIPIFIESAIPVSKNPFSTDVPPHYIMESKPSRNERPFSF